MDSSELDKKKKDLKERLENELYVDRYSTFKESVDLINLALESFGINYQYTYNSFCNDFTVECMEFLEEYPNVDMNDPQNMVIYTLPIIMSILKKKQIKYGSKDDKLNSENIS